MRVERFLHDNGCEELRCSTSPCDKVASVRSNSGGESDRCMMYILVSNESLSRVRHHHHDALVSVKLEKVSRQGFKT